MSRSGQISKARAICVILLILVSTAAMIGLLSRFGLIQEPSNDDGSPHFSDCPFEVTTVSTAEGTWVSFNPNEDPDTPAEAHVIVSDTMGLTVVADISGYWKDNKTQIIDAASYSFDTIHVPGMHPIRTSGTPDLPHLIAYVEVPKDIDIAVEEVRGTHHILEGYSVGPNPSLPASTWPRDAQSVPRIEFGDIYDSNAFYPSEKVSITGGDSAASIIMRGRRLLEIRFHPIQYNASSNDLRVHARLMARLNYSRPAQIEPARPGLQCEQFENVFDGFLLNYKLWNASTIAPTEPDTFPDSNQFTIASFPSERLAAEYLIIVHDDFADEAERLARWKNRTGLLTRFYTTSQIVEFAEGSGDVTPQQIKSFIQYTYSSWNPGPMFVLLFGDSEYIPTNYEMVHKDFTVYHQEQGFIGEDLEYFTVDGTDYIPDLFYGRISVDSVDEARTVVDKILAYERYPPDKAAFYKNILAASYFDDIQIDNWDPEVPPVFDPDGDGVEDEGYPYIEGSEAVKNYLELLEGFDYKVHVNYSANTTVPHVTPYMFYDWWIDFPEYLETYPWMSIEDVDLDASTQAILSNFNEGRFLVYHIDHGGSRNSHFLTHEEGEWQEIEGWANPRFESTDLAGLTNGNNLSLVINIDCSTGWFDGETDQEAMGDNFAQAFDNIESLAEMLLRKEGGGAIAVIAASRVIYNWPGVDLLEGIIDAFWPGYFEEDFHPVYEVGAALHYGKMNLLNVYGYDGVIKLDDIPQHETEATFRMYHVFGDPTTPLWTREPSNLVVEYPSKIGTERTQRFAVKVTNSTGFPVARAKVCIQMENGDYQVSRTNFLGYVEFSVGNLPSGEMNVTVTLQNSTHHFIPHAGTIEVTESSATVIPEYPGRGDKDSQAGFAVDGFTLDQDVTIYFETQEDTFPYTETSNTASFLVGEGIIGPINVVANQTNGNTAVTVFYRLPDIYVDPYLERGEKYSNPSITVLVESTTAAGAWLDANMERLVAGVFLKIFVGVWNQGEDEAKDVAVDLYYHAYGAGLSERPINRDTEKLDILPGQKKEVEFSWTPTDTGATCLIARIDHPFDVNLRNNVARVNAYVVGVSSPGNVSFYIGNPTENEAFPYLELRQEGDFADYWNASVRGYSSCPIAPHENVSVEFVVHVNDSIDAGESRIFIVDLYINGHLWEGIRINVTKMEIATTTTDWIKWIVDLVTNPFFWAGIVVVVIIAGVCCVKRRST